MRPLLRPRLAYILSAVLLLAGCVDDPTASAPEPGPKPTPRVVGLYEFTLTGISGGSDIKSSVAAVPTGPGQSLSPVTTGLAIELVTSSHITYGSREQGGQRYVIATYRLRNMTGLPLTNLTFIPAMTASTIPGTPFTSVLLLNNTAANPAIASKFAPSGAVTVTNESALSSTWTDVLQVFEESEVAAITPPPEVTGLLPYGFVVRNPATPDSRTLPPAADANDFAGSVTFAFRIPLQPTANEDPYNISWYTIGVEDTETRITESIEEGQDTSAIRQIRERATALGATTVTVLAGSSAVDSIVPDYPGQRQICSVRTAGSAGSPVTFITEPGAYSKIQVLRPGETPDDCGANFLVGTPQPPALNVPYVLTAQAMDIYGNVKANSADTVWLDSEGAPVTLPAPAPLISGIQQFTVTYTGYGTSHLRAVGPQHRGLRSIPVTGVTRTWTGKVSTDWETGGNWMELSAPGSLDSVSIPTSRRFYPVLTSNILIGGVSVDDGATLDLDTFDLTATASVFTGGTSGIITSTTGRLILAGTGTGKTLQGTLPRIQVTGNYSLAGPVVSRARVEVAGGRLRTVGHRLQTISY